MPRFGHFRKKSVDEEGQPKKKYNARRVEIDGVKLDSQFEARAYLILKESPNVKILEIHPRYLLQEKYRTRDGRNIRCIEYVSDFVIEIDADIYIVDIKGMETTDFKIKRKIFEKRYPEKILKIIKNMKELRLLIG